MPTIYRVPPEYSSIRDEIVAHALGEGPEPTDTEALENFRNWLIYESSAAGDLGFECVIRLADLEFEDDEVRAFGGGETDAGRDSEAQEAHQQVDGSENGGDEAVG